MMMFSPTLAFAVPDPGGQKDSGGQTPIIAGLPNPLGDKVDSIPALVYLLVQIVVDISYVVIAFFLILSGFKFVAARGNETELTNAKNTFKYTIIGALLIIGAQTIIAVVKNIISGL